MNINNTPLEKVDREQRRRKTKNEYEYSKRIKYERCCECPFPALKGKIFCRFHVCPVEGCVNENFHKDLKCETYHKVDYPTRYCLEHEVEYAQGTIKVNSHEEIEELRNEVDEKLEREEFNEYLAGAKRWKERLDDERDEKIEALNKKVNELEIKLQLLETKYSELVVKEN